MQLAHLAGLEDGKYDPLVHRVVADAKNDIANPGSTAIASARDLIWHLHQVRHLFAIGRDPCFNNEEKHMRRILTANSYAWKHILRREGFVHVLVAK